MRLAQETQRAGEREKAMNAEMRIGMGIVVAVMGVAMLRMTDWAFVQIFAGGFLAYMGARQLRTERK